MTCERAMRRKNRLKKNLNWLKSTTGIKVMMLYFWFFTRLLTNLLGVVFPFMNTFLFYKIQFEESTSFESVRPSSRLRK